MIDIHFICEGIKDVCEFVRLYPSAFPPNFQNHFSGESSGVFTITRNENGETWTYPKNELKEVFKSSNLEGVLNDLTALSLENKGLKEEIERLNNQLVKASPRQNLEVNQILISTINLYRTNGLSFQKIADKLNNDGYKNSRGNTLNSMQVKRLFDKQSKVDLKKGA